MSSNKPKVAMLVDADNISPKYISQIHEKAKACGELVLWYVCGTENHLKGWREHSQAYGFTVHEVPVGENSTDKYIVRECAVMGVFNSKIDAFCLVTNDKHFVKACEMLKQWQKRVIVIGKKHAAKSLKKVAEFVEIPTTKTSPKPASPKKTVKIQTSPTNQSLEIFKEVLKKAFAIINKEWIDLAKLGQALKQVDSSFHVKDYGSSLKKALKKLQGFIEWDADKVKLKA